MVPKRWQATQIGDVATFSSGGTPSKQTADYWGGGEPWISGKDLKSHYLNKSIDTLTEKGFATAKKAPQGASLILVRGMTLLKDFPVGYASREVAFNQDIKALVPKKNVDGLFLSFLLVAQKNRIRQLVSTAGHGTGRLDTSLIQGYPINLPPLPEQKKIAQILSTWDQAITATERLLENSQQRKKGLMQQLLTGKKRLPGFVGEWEKTTLGAIGRISSAGVDKKIVEGEKSARLLNYLDVFRREFIFDHELTHEVTAPERKIANCDVRKGDVFFTPSSETREEVGIPAVAVEDMPGVVYSYHVVRFRPSRPLDLSFAAYAFQTDEFRSQTYRLCDGSGQRYVLSQDDFRSIQITVPDLAEQKAIGLVLKAASDEILALSDRINCLKQEKKALMQQLLTGKRRVQVEAA